MAIVIGLTGGIAMGKSTVSQFLESNGVAIVDADKVAHQILTSSKVILRLTEAFGKSILTDEQTINRQVLGQIVFSDSKQLENLNQIVQPAIRIEIIKQIRQFKAKQVIILDAPLLFEQRYEDMVDFVMVVATSQKEQLKRLMDRDQISEKEAQKRIAAQMTIEEKKKRADIVIDTGGTIEETRNQVVKWLVNSKLFKSAENFSEVK